MIDLAISMTLLGGAPASGAIILGKDIKTGLPSILDYGVPDKAEEEAVVAAIAAGKARFEFGEKPDV
jgi:hypothetical protein